MSLFGKLFGSTPKKHEAVEYKNYFIEPDPADEGGQFRLQAIITKEIDGEIREHRLIRADILPTKQQAVDFAIEKAKKMIDEQGDALFFKG